MIATAEEQECYWEEATSGTFSREDLRQLSQEAKDWEQLRAMLPLPHHVMLTERPKLYL